MHDRNSGITPATPATQFSLRDHKNLPRPIASGGDAFGCHRVVAPATGLPQAAQRVDNDFSRLFEGETLVAVETLNIDAASFRQMEESSSGLPSIDEGVAECIRQTVSQRGKQHNPVTGSGGMLLGRVLQVAPGHRSHKISEGERIATLVSLSLTPLYIRKILAVRRTSAQLDVDGEAVVFGSGAVARLPDDMPDRLALAMLDVAGAAPQVARLVTSGNTVLVTGAGGKSGLLCCAEARRRGGPEACIIGLENHPPYADELRKLGLCDFVIEADARNPTQVRQSVLEASGGKEADVTFSCVNVPDAEMGAILATRNRGVVYFFAMSTSFTKAALGAEGVGKDVDLMIGNGFALDHAEHTLNLVRDLPALRAVMAARYM